MAKTIRRAIAILLAATAIILLVLPASDVNATYTKGDYVLDGGTLVSYTGTEEDITIPLGVTTIGKDAFSGNNTLTKVYIPDEVTSIDYAAFENCKNLKKVQIGDGVKSIGQSAFSGCLSLSNVNIPRYTESIGSGAFAACPSLTDIEVNSKNRHYVCLDGVLYTRDGSKMVQYLAGRPYSTYDIPEPVKEIEEFGFYGANMLTTVGIINGVEEVPEYAFLNCTALNKVELPNTIRAIRKGAFGGCTNLTKLSVPTTCGLIDSEAFTSMDGVKGDVVNETNGEVLSESGDSTAVASNTEASDNNTQATNNDNQPSLMDAVQEITGQVAETVESVTDAVTSGLTDKELGSTTIVGGQAVFLIDPTSMNVRGFDIDAAQTEDSIADSGNSSSAGEDIRAYSGRDYDVIDGIMGHYGKSDPNVVIPDGTTRVGNRVFYNNKDINSVMIPASVREIGDFAFARSSLASVDIPAGTEKIGYAAFYNCNNLANINVPSSVKEIELGAFDNTAFINNWRSIEDGNNFLVLGDGVLVAYKGHGSEVDIPASVKTIGPGVFEGNNRIKSVTISNNCKKISEDAFNGCRKLSSIKLPDNLETIEDRAFKDTGLTYVELPMTVRSIGLGAFDTYDVNGGMDAVVFKGSFLPDLTYKPTATRLSADNLRTNAFRGTDFAFVPAGVNLDSGSIFDADKYGFRGEIYSSSDSASDGTPYLQLRKCTKEPDINGLVECNSEIQIGNNLYYLSGVSERAFDDYKDPSWCKNKLTAIQLNGDNSKALNEMLADINFSASSGSNENSVLDDPIKISSPDNSVNTLYCDATLPGNSGAFNLSVKRNESLKNDFNKAFDNRFGSHDGVYMDTYSIDMSDRLGSVPIKKMANDKLNITLPVPSSFNEAENIKIATLDDNGLLESVAGEVAERGDGTKTISFVASHLSPFAIFVSDANLFMIGSNSNDVANGDSDELTLVTESVDSEESLADGNNNILPGTVIYGTLQKEVAPGIPVRYIIASIMLVIAGVLGFYKKKKVMN